MDIGLSNKSPRAKIIKANMNRWNYNKQKLIPQKKQRQPTELEKLIANNISNKGIISKIYEEFIQVGIKETIILKMDRGHEYKYFSKEDIEVVDRHMERCSISLIIREMQIKTTKRDDLTPVRMTITNK